MLLGFLLGAECTEALFEMMTGILFTDKGCEEQLVILLFKLTFPSTWTKFEIWERKR